MSEAGTRSRKKEFLSLLQSDDFEETLSVLKSMPGRQVINALFSMLCHQDQIIRWRAVMAMGRMLEKLASEDIEGARIVMRRLMWSLNDESGGIGWGAPEVMGEAMAHSDILAKEYSSMLGSYADEKGNFLEHVPLQRGLLWAWARLSEKRPEALGAWRNHLYKYLESADPIVRGHALMAVGNLGLTEAKAQLKSLLKDEKEFETFQTDKIITIKIKDLAQETINRLNNLDRLNSGTSG